MASYLVTGAGRGLGFELVSQLVKFPKQQVSVVFAAIRVSPSDALQQLIGSSEGRIVQILLPVTDKAGIVAGVAQVEKILAGAGLDVLINNAGISPFHPKGIATMDNLGEAISVNVEAVHNVTAALLPLLRKGTKKKVVNV